MKVLFINGSGSDSSINSYIGSAIDFLSANGHNAKELVLRNMKYSPCKGCFNCWVKTPGTCVFKDDVKTFLAPVLKMAKEVIEPTNDDGDKNPA
jgi:multimeric flavodoxin WrbA